MPRRSKTSASERTIVVFPVPPFWDRTAIASDIEPDYMRAGHARRNRMEAAADPHATDPQARRRRLYTFASLQPRRVPARRRRGNREVTLLSSSSSSSPLQGEQQWLSPE